MRSLRCWLTFHNAVYSITTLGTWPLKMAATRINVIDLSSQNVVSFMGCIIELLNLQQQQTNIILPPSDVVPLPSMRIHPKHQHLYSQSKTKAKIFNITVKILFIHHNNISILPNNPLKPIINWTHLIQLNLSFNRLSILPKHQYFWRYFPKLTVLLLHDNELHSLSNIRQSLQSIASQIKVFTIHNNPCCKVSKYRHQILHLMPNLLLLNHHLVSDAEILGLYEEGSDEMPNTNVDSTEFKFISYNENYDGTQHLFIVENQLKILEEQRKASSPALKIQRAWRSYKS